MATASGDKKSKRNRAAQAKSHTAPKRKTHRAASKPLNTQRDATRKQEPQKQRRENRAEQRREIETMPLSAGLDMIGVMNRRTTAVLELPARLARCHSPFDLWREQTRFVQGIFSDCQSLAQRLMTNALDTLPMPRSTRE